MSDLNMEAWAVLLCVPAWRCYYEILFPSFFELPPLFALLIPAAQLAEVFDLQTVGISVILGAIGASTPMSTSDAIMAGEV
jgi:hypothetical protein